MSTSRFNAGYDIVDSIHVEGVEFVLGVHQTIANHYVTWRCNDMKNYYWGRYFTDHMKAVKDLCHRASEHARQLGEIKKDAARTGQNRQKAGRDYER